MGRDPEGRQAQVGPAWTNPNPEPEPDPHPHPHPHPHPNLNPNPSPNPNPNPNQVTLMFEALLAAVSAAVEQKAGKALLAASRRGGS